MSIFKDWIEDTDGYVLTSRIRSFFDPKLWLRLAKWRRQRANRGWSDRDTWGAGDHIAEMTAQMLQYLVDNGMCDWDKWFEYNVKQKGSYKDLQSVINDINQYIEFTKASWADDLTCEGNMLDKDDDGHVTLNTTWRYKKNGRKLSEQQITGRIKSWSKKEATSYKRAQKAMQFFGRNFAGFWD